MTLREQLRRKLLEAGYTEEGPDYFRKVWLHDRREIAFAITKWSYEKSYREYPASEGWYFKKERLTKKGLSKLSLWS